MLPRLPLLFTLALASSTLARPPTILRGRVVAYDAERRDGPPVPGAIVRLVESSRAARLLRGRQRLSRITIPREGRDGASFPPPPPPPPPPHEARTDAQGRYRLEVPAGSYRILVEHPDLEPWRVGPNALGPGKDRQWDLRTWRRATLASLPPQGRFPHAQRATDLQRQPLLEMRAARQDLGVGEKVSVSFQVPAGHRYRRVVVGCTGCPLDPEGDEHPSGFVRNIFCEQPPCQEDLELAFYQAGTYVVAARALIRDEPDRRDYRFLRFRVGPDEEAPDPAPGPAQAPGWLGK